MEVPKRISVVMCTYQGEKFLREQLDSIVGQTYPVFELWIQDDGSTDGTVDIIREYAARHPFIRWQMNTRNQGFNANFRAALQQARGEFIAISDQDDIWHVDKLEKMVKTMGAHSLCYSFSVTSEQQNLSDVMRNRNDNNILERLLFSNAISGHNMLLRKTLVDQIEVWDDTLLYDWWLAVNAYLHDGVSRCEQILTWHRIHPGSAMKSYHPDKAKAYIPYLKGYSAFKELQTRKSWQLFYQYIYEKSKGKKGLALVHRLSGCMLRKGVMSFFRLCVLSMKYREKLMPRQGINVFRSFFYPCFYAHQNRSF